MFFEQNRLGMTGIYFWQIIGWHCWMVPNLSIRFCVLISNKMRICCDTLFGCKSAMTLRYLGKTYFGLVISQSGILKKQFPYMQWMPKKWCKMLRIWPSKPLTCDLWIVGLELRQVHQYPYCWELRDHEVLKIDGFFTFFFINDDIQW